MDFYIACYKGREHLDTQVRQNVLEAAAFCKSYKDGNKFTIHKDKKDSNSYLVGVRLNDHNDHIDWARVPLVPIQ